MQVNVANLPTIQKGEINEEKIEDYMEVLRKTNREIGKSLEGERIKKKAEEYERKKLENINIFKSKLRQAQNQKKHSLKKTIKEMRKQRIFPLPKSYTNYKHRNGLLSKNSIHDLRASASEF